MMKTRVLHYFVFTWAVMNFGSWFAGIFFSKAAAWVDNIIPSSDASESVCFYFSESFKSVCGRRCGGGELFSSHSSAESENECQLWPSPPHLRTLHCALAVFLRDPGSCYEKPHNFWPTPCTLAEISTFVRPVAKDKRRTSRTREFGRRTHQLHAIMLWHTLWRLLVPQQPWDAFFWRVYLRARAFILSLCKQFLEQLKENQFVYHKKREEWRC